MQWSSVWVATIATSALLGLPGVANGKTTVKSNSTEHPVKARLDLEHGKLETSAPDSSEPEAFSNPERPEEEQPHRTVTNENPLPKRPVQQLNPEETPAVSPLSLEEKEEMANTAQRPVFETIAELELPETAQTQPKADSVADPSEDRSETEANAPTPLPDFDLVQQTQEQTEAEPEVLVAEVVIRGDTELLSIELEDVAYAAIVTAPGRTTTRAQLIEDTNAIYATGYFANVEPLAEETALGVRVVFAVEPNPIVTQVRVQGNRVLTQERVNEIFQDQYGNILNFQDFQDGINQVNDWYQGEGYVLAQVIDPPPFEEGAISPPAVAEDGTVTLEVAEGVIENIQIRFRNEDGEALDPDGNPIEGRTQEYIVTREMRLKEGDVFNRGVLLEDLQRIVGLGLFEDAEFSAEPGTDPRQVVLVLNATEGSFGSFNFGGGFSSSTGFFGSVGGEFLNIGGRNLRLGGETQVGTRGTFFDLRFTNPWIAGDPYRTSYTVNGFRRRSISLVFDGSQNGDRREIELPNGDRPRVQRFGGRINFTRPLSDNPLERSEWVASLGLEFQNVSIRDSDGDLETEDERGNQLAFNDDGTDNLLNARFAISRDRRNSILQPTQGSFLNLSTEQSIPIDGIFYNSVRGNFSYYIPVKITDFDDGPQAFAFNIQAGTIIGDFPPYEAFVLGGTNTIRGFEEGDVGAGRSFAQATIEYRFPVFSVVGGALFLDAATTFGSQGSVPGEPGVVRRKPGEGIGYGVGVRIQSPIGPIRVDFGWNNEGDNRFHFGIGERF